MIKVTSWAGRHKKLLIFLGAAAVLGAAAFWFVGRPMLAARAMASAQEQSVSYIRTTTLAKTTLSDTVSASGTVESANVSSVTTTLNYTVKTIPVQVGDTVSPGDIICTLDTSELDKRITRERENITEAQEKAQDAYEDAKEALHDARDALDEYEDKISEAYSTCSKAYSAYTTASNSVASFQSAAAAAQAAYDASALAVNSALANKNAAESAYSAAVTAAAAAATAVSEAATTYGLGSPEHIAAQTAQSNADAAVVAAQGVLGDAGSGAVKAYNDAVDAQTMAKSNLNTANSELEAARTNAAYNSAYQNYSTAKNAYEGALSNLSTYEKQEESCVKALATASDNLEKAAESDTLDDLIEQLDDCTLRAESAGKVTALNATVGNVCSGTVATIQDTEDLKITISIAEYDIQNVAVGMNAVITSDAVDGEIDGTLSQISPTATVGQGSSSTFSAEVSVIGGSNGLLIGVNAKVQIILSTTDDVFVVPLDAVEQDESDGKSYVYVKTGGEGMQASFERVEITTGASTDYYVEIMGSNVSEGTEVRSSANLEEATATSDASMNFMFGGNMGGGNMGGGNMGGGNMPSGERPSGRDMGEAQGGM